MSDGVRARDRRQRVSSAAVGLGRLRGGDSSSTPPTCGGVRLPDAPAPSGRSTTTGYQTIRYERSGHIGTLTVARPLGPANERTAEQWSRAILEDAPSGFRRMLQAGWSAIGLTLGGAAPDLPVLA
jgi:hypothetical protein